MTDAVADTIAAGSSAYAELRRSILEFDLMPGERLSERGLEQALRASRTPIRAALMRLEVEGLTRREGRGWMVAPIDLSEVRAVMEYREIVEIGVVQRVIERATDAEIAELEPTLITEHHADDPASWLESGSAFHLALAELTGNLFLTDAVASTLTRLARPRWLVVRTPESRAHVRDDHRAIFDAVSVRDADAATALIAAHTAGTRERLVGFLADERTRLRGRGFSIVES
ncbi:GntR family transcriptional regulator [Leucobacter japonicus]|uniref:GntR family transcriptional regulator n=1 Tax=Leucobacter japonicus TaxID=1461259 RepID=UPI0006A76C95|nr:GntR family transcriptional regulator [Leucobacter japonicus]